jgi:purine-binding chemotaxis protein CheW
VSGEAAIEEPDARVLRERARRLSSAPVRGAEDGALFHAVGFSRGKERYAVERLFIRELLPLPQVTPLPCVPAFVRGIINVRGRILPVLDLDEIFGNRAREIRETSSIIIIQSVEREFGLLADEILGLVEIPVSRIQPSPPTLPNAGAAALSGVTSDGWALLNAAGMLADRDLVVDENVGSSR